MNRKAQYGSPGSEPQNIEAVAKRVKALSEAMLAHEKNLTPARAKQIRQTIAEASANLSKLIEDLDPIRHPGRVFDPSNPEVAGRIIAIAMVAQPRKPLANEDNFYGSGVYALYYNGSYPAYAPISKREHPIYVGKADPATPSSKTAVEQGNRLARRLSDHRKNIAKATSTLKVEDFEYRALVVQTGWQVAAESYLIHLFKPIWNSEVKIAYGLGKHGDDPGTRANLRSPWDTLHPGRDWASRDPKMQDARSPKRISDDVAEHLKRHPPLETLDEILRRFLDEMTDAT